MTFSIYFPDITIYNVVIYQLRIFVGLCIILWAKSLKKKGIRSQNVSSLFVWGIIFTIFSGIFFWLPGIQLYGAPTDAERLLFYGISIFYEISYPILFIILGVFLLQYFRQYLKENMKNDKKVLVGPIVFIVSYGLLIILEIGVRYVYVFEGYSLYSLLYFPFMIGLLIIFINIIVSIAFLFLYFLHINNEFLLLFGTIELGLVIVNLISNINYLSLYIW
jgi:hypothetical protein